MFTGIVQMVGRISQAKPHGDGLRIAVDTGLHSLVAVGDSVAVRGCCLTVVAIEGATLSFDVSAETLRCTNGLDRTGDVNLELALRLSDRLGGHLMSGHVDGVGSVRSYAAIAGDANGSFGLVVDAPVELARFIAPKGSIAVEGISLTIAALTDDYFEVAIIPKTWEVTNFSQLKPGDEVNLEADMIAKYVERLLRP